jgi:hypothetical protein
MREKRIVEISVCEDGSIDWYDNIDKVAYTTYSGGSGLRILTGRDTGKQLRGTSEYQLYPKRTSSGKIDWENLRRQIMGK